MAGDAINRVVALGQGPLRRLDADPFDVGRWRQDVVKWTILVRDGESMQDGLAAFGEVWGWLPDPPAITVAYVSGFAVPDAIIEIEALAAVPA